MKKTSPKHSAVGNNIQIIEQPFHIEVIKSDIKKY